MWEGVRVAVRRGEQFAWAAFGAGGVRFGVLGLCAGGVCGSLGGVGVPCSMGLFAVGVCGLPGVGGGDARSVGGSAAGLCGCSGGGAEACVAGTGGVHDGGRVWATWWGVGREGQGVWGWVRVRRVGVPVRLQRRGCVVSCRSGGFLKEELASFRGSGKDFADVCAYLMHFLVGGWKRVLQVWAKAHAPEDPVEGVVPADEGVLWPWGGVLTWVRARLDLCVGG